LESEVKELLWGFVEGESIYVMEVEGGGIFRVGFNGFGFGP
jgi:hypothetical protein